MGGGEEGGRGGKRGERGRKERGRKEREEGKKEGKKWFENNYLHLVRASSYGTSRLVFPPMLCEREECWRTVILAMAMSVCSVPKFDVRTPTLEPESMAGRRYGWHLWTVVWMMGHVGPCMMMGEWRMACGSQDRWRESVGARDLRWKEEARVREGRAAEGAVEPVRRKDLNSSKDRSGDVENWTSSDTLRARSNRLQARRSASTEIFFDPTPNSDPPLPPPPPPWRPSTRLPLLRTLDPGRGAE